jgi:sulfate adenylyltransferase
MIKPVGSDELRPRFVYDPEQHHRLSREAESLPSVIISSQAAGNAVMLGAGYFSPLDGFMNLADALSAAQSMTLTDGRFFPVPLLCLLESADALAGATRIALRDPNVEGNPVLAVMDVTAVEQVSDAQMALMTEQVYGTSDPKHPGVQTFNSQGRIAISGPIQVLNFSYFQTDFPDTFRTAVEIRHEIQERGWQRSSPSRPATPCIARTRNCARWRWRRSRPMASSSTCCSVSSSRATSRRRCAMPPSAPWPSSISRPTP